MPLPRSFPLSALFFSEKRGKSEGQEQGAILKWPHGDHFVENIRAGGLGMSLPARSHNIIGGYTFFYSIQNKLANSPGQLCNDESGNKREDFN